MNGKIVQTWQEAVEEQIDVTEFNLVGACCPAHAMALPVVRETGDARRFAMSVD